MTSEQIEHLKSLAKKATPGPWKWADAYDFREHIDHKEEGLDAKCENIEDGRIELNSPSGVLLKEWSIYAEDGGIHISLPDAAFIAACDPNTIMALIEKIESLQHQVTYLEFCNGWRPDIENKIISDYIDDQIRKGERD